MSRGTNSKSQHDAADTDAFLLQVVREDGRPDYQSVDNKQAAPAKTAPQDPSLYQAMHPARKTYKNGCSRCLVATWSIALFLIGIAAVVVGVLQTTKQNVLPVFPESMKFAHPRTLYLTGAAFGALGLVGILACKTRVKVVAYFFALVMTLLSVGFLAVGVVAVLYKTDAGTFQIDWDAVWKESVKQEDTKFLCQVQQQLQCSGYDTCCNAPRYTGGGATASTNATCTAGSLKAGLNIADVCSAECPESNKFTDVCNGKIKTFLDGAFIALTAVAFGMFVIFVILACGSCRMTTKGY